MSDSPLAAMVTDLREQLGAGGTVELVQTHASVVLLTPTRAFKLKKPLDLGFLDHSTRERRLAACRAEVELNRRLAPTTYLGVRDVVLDDGRLRLCPPDARSEEPVDHVVEMVRLPDDARLSDLLDAERAGRAELEALGRRIARFHAAARRDADVARQTTPDAVRELLTENLAETRGAATGLLDDFPWARLETALARALDRSETILAARCEAGRPCDGHGDLRLEHCYFLDEGIVVVDCIEFAERFRVGDPCLDVAFLVMELEDRERADLARALFDAWAVPDDADSGALLPLFVAHRRLVRCKVAALRAGQDEVPEADREAARRESLRHALGALTRLVAVAEPETVPALVLVGGLPGSGKSTLARALRDSAGFEIVASDRVRKELSGIAPSETAAAAPGEGIYGADATRATYDEVLARCRRALAAGRRVVADASFTDEKQRSRALGLAAELGVPALFVECRVPEELARRRLAERRGDPSDADATIRAHLGTLWDPPSARTEAVHVAADMARSPASQARAVAAALERRVLDART